jgi:hypothetical protein
VAQGFPAIHQQLWKGLEGFPDSFYGKVFYSQLLGNPSKPFQPFQRSSPWLADGFHRYFAAKAAARTTIHEDITPGTRREAILYSLSANTKHGLRRSNADKRRAVQTLLDDAEWSQWSSNEIAKRCAVGVDMVIALRNSSLSETKVTEREVKTKHGTTTTMNTANIGKKSKPAEPEKPAEPTPPPEPEYTPLDAANDQISDLQDALALATAGNLSDQEKEQAAGLIARLREEIRVLTATLKAITVSRNHYQAENGELKQQIRLQRREIDKLAGTRTA